jgi:CelD/BcsL family acetyltransferase involved in cellulose biosynthesis
MAEMHIQRWRERGEPSAFAIPSHCHWLAEVVHELFRMGWAYLASITFNGKTVAVGCYFLFRRRLTSYVYSFESSLSRYSPATLLAWMVLEHCEAEWLADIFDWGEGREEYKSRWTRDYFSLYRLFLSKQYGGRSHLLLGWSRRLKPWLQSQARYWTILRRAKHRWQGLKERLG